MTDDAEPGSPGLTRRRLLQTLGLAGAAAIGLPRIAEASTVARAAAQPAAGSDLGAVEHVVFLMMENRSYDHYFGAYPRGRGFDDHPPHRLGAFAQPYPDGGELSPPGVLLPFRLTGDAMGECTKDLTHDWGPMHQCWNGGRMDSFVRVHTSAANEGNPTGALTMGYYTREELDFYYALADQFTLCDAYHCSILGPTHPNRVMSISGTIDPAGGRGGPITDTSPDPRVRWTCHWPTVQELLEDAGVSWKVYHPSYADLATLGADAAKYAELPAYPTFNPAIYDPTANPTVMLMTDHVLPYFAAFENPTSALYQKAFLPTFPAGFLADVKAGTLPSVSWLIPPLGFDEHPSASPDHGMWFSATVLDALVSNPDVWSKTVLFLMYDENDGFFDHLAPPTAPPGTADEWLTAGTISSTTLGIRGPLGLGVRVPSLVVSPFSRGGAVVSEVLDHTSQLRFLEARFGVHVPEISAWRRSTVGDLTSALFASAPDASMPALPTQTLGAPALTGPCAEPLQEAEFVGGAEPSVPQHQTMPTQHDSTTPGNAYFPGPAPTPSPAASHQAPPTGGSTQSSTRGEVAQLGHTGGLPRDTSAVALIAAALALGAASAAAKRADDDFTGGPPS